MKKTLALATLLPALAVLSACGSGGSSAFGYRHCPRVGPAEDVGHETAGKKGKAVPANPASALVCRWNQESGSVERTLDAALATAGGGCVGSFSGHRVTLVLDRVRCATAHQVVLDYAEILAREPVVEPREHVVVDREWFCHSLLVPGTKIGQARGYACRLLSDPRHRFHFLLPRSGRRT
jgi:hypothetical protein